MASVLIAYGSTTGNTENTAQMIGKVFKDAGADVSIRDVSDLDPKGLCSSYDMVLFGCSTWGDDTIELQDDFVPFLEGFDQIQAKGKKVAVFGCGDSSYTFFCGAVDVISDELARQGADVLDTLKIDGSPQTEAEEIRSWAKKLAKSM